jgi:hypothetical protein
MHRPHYIHVQEVNRILSDKLSSAEEDEVTAEFDKLEEEVGSHSLSVYCGGKKACLQPRKPRPCI